MNGNQSTSTHDQKSLAKKMLLRCTPEGVQRLAWSLEHLPNHLTGFSVEELDEIAAGENTEQHLVNVGDGTYLDGVLPCLNWWIGVAEGLTFGRSIEGTWADPTFEGQRKKLLTLLNDTLSSYAAALAVTLHYSKYSPSESGLELLKRYRIYTRAVCDFAREVWPEVNLEWLYTQP